jgi:2-methylcitrate dehydratase
MAAFRPVFPVVARESGVAVRINKWEQPMQTLAERLAEYAAALRFEHLPDAVVREVKRRVIDALGCALGAWDAEPCEIARRVALSFSAKNGAALLGTTHRAPPDWAAFANGCLVRYFDYNDTYLSKEPAHPSDNIPAALAVAETEGASGRDLIVAIALAYEIQCRLCDTASLRSRGWDHVTYVVFSTALAAARLMRLDAERAQHAVNIAGVRSASLRQTRAGELSHWKACTVASAARHGVFAAMLAREGMTGPAPIFEGEMGFEKLLGVRVADVNVGGASAPRRSGGAPPGHGAEAPPTLDPPTMILKTSIKFWPAEYHSQSAIEAALKVREKIWEGHRKPDRPGRADLDAIESVLIQSHAAAVEIIGSGREKWRPQNRETADHSLPYIVAVALADGEITERQFARERFTDAELLDLLQRVKVERHAEMTALYPGTAANIVTVRLRDGRTLTERVDYPRGHAKNPLKDAEVGEKFHALADSRLGRERAAAALAWLWKLDEAKDVGELPPLVELRSG